jgi:outer membrane protein assembly factor BamB
MRSACKLISSIFFILILNGLQAQEVNWTHFRGSQLNGIAGNEKIPLKWDESTIRWKTAIHDKGYSSPVIFGDQIWLTTASSEGKELYAVCIDFNTGRIVFDIKVFTPSEVEGKHSLNTYATPTPCIEKGYVYVHYGSLGTACIKTSDGSIVWKRTDLKCKHVQGPASSPVLYRNLLFLHFDGTDVQFIVALDKSTGKQVWRQDRPAGPYKALTEIGRKAYITPIIINAGGRDLLISPGSAICSAYDPLTGKEIWSVVDGAESTIAMPFTEKGILYWYAGYAMDNDLKYADLLAVRPEGTGDITSSNILWKRREELADNQMLTPVIREGLIYTISTKNNMYCVDASNGKDIWSQHMTSPFNASPLFADGNVWFFSSKGEALAIKAGKEFRIVARNQMDSGIWATPAILRNSVILRTQNYLYRICNN